MSCVIWSIFCGVADVVVYPRSTAVYCLMSLMHITSRLLLNHAQQLPSNRATQRNSFATLTLPLLLQIHDLVIVVKLKPWYIGQRHLVGVAVLCPCELIQYVLIRAEFRSTQGAESDTTKRRVAAIRPPVTQS